MMTLKNILVATDFSELSDAALIYGRELASRFGATLHFLHVVQSDLNFLGPDNFVAADPELQRRLEADARKRLDEALIDSDGRGPRALPAVVTAGSVPSAIIDYAKDRDIDIIVMGTHGRSGVAHMLMGSVAERVVRLARCPVLTVRHPEHDFVRPDTLVALAGVGTTPQKARN